MAASIWNSDLFDLEREREREREPQARVETLGLSRERERELERALDGLSRETDRSLSKSERPFRNSRERPSRVEFCVEREREKTTLEISCRRTLPPLLVARREERRELARRGHLRSRLYGAATFSVCNSANSSPMWTFGARVLDSPRGPRASSMELSIVTNALSPVSDHSQKTPLNSRSAGGPASGCARTRCFGRARPRWPCCDDARSSP